jgi:predicted enzyme related to lactoylglutathione lyase
MLYSLHRCGFDRAGGTTVAIAWEIMEVFLYVQDMGAQVSFYRDLLGLEVREPLNQDDWTGVHWVELETCSCTLALHADGQLRLGADAPKIVFRVLDVPAACRQLVQRGVPMSEIGSPVPGVHVADGVDPEGNRFSIKSRGGVES